MQTTGRPCSVKADLPMLSGWGSSVTCSGSPAAGGLWSGTAHHSSAFSAAAGPGLPGTTWDHLPCLPQQLGRRVAAKGQKPLLRPALHGMEDHPSRLGIPQGAVARGQSHTSSGVPPTVRCCRSCSEGLFHHRGSGSQPSTYLWGLRGLPWKRKTSSCLGAYL